MEFEEAVEDTVEYLEKSFPVGPGGVILNRMTYENLEDLESDHTATSLVARASHDPHTFQLLKLKVAHLLELDRPLRPVVRSWLVKYLRDEVKNPGNPRGVRPDVERDELMLDLVERLVAKGFYATRNDATGTTDGADGEACGTSACDVIAEANRRFGIKPDTFNAVKGAYHRAKERDASAGRDR